ncbi:MAG TPA: hypothetical protein VMS99_10855 [Acidimicrobiia bacterium]|nr:hypothetical protein [Acidimicrobiia bacterium]
MRKPCIGQISGAEGAERAADVTRNASDGICVAEGEATCDSV